jgi:hypothetical protein
MKKLALMMSIVFVFALSADAAGPKTLTRTIEGGDIGFLKLDSGIGDITITANTDQKDIAIEVILTPRRGGFFSSKRQAERDVDAATLEAVVEKDRLSLWIESSEDKEDRRFEEQWNITVPARLKIRLDHDVGDIEVDGVVAGVELDSGVGDVAIEVPEGNVNVDLGVGTAVVRAPAMAYGAAEAAGGVGDARLTVHGKKVDGGGFIAKAASWTGDGSYRIQVSVGVGDAIIKLD